MGKKRSKKRTDDTPVPPRSAEGVAPVWDRRELVSAGLAALVTLGVYLATLAPGMTLDDSGELTLAAWEPGVPHPPGFPTWLALGTLFARLPGGEVAARLNLMSACLGAVAVAGLVLILLEIHRTQPRPHSQEGGRKSGKGRTDNREATGPAPLVALWAVAGGVTFGLGLTVWRYATEAEVYTLHLAFTAWILALLLAWRRLRTQTPDTRSERILLPAAALLYGLALGVHNASILLMTPGLGLLVLLTARSSGLPVRELFGRRLLAVLGAAGLGLSIYALLPVLSARDPVLDWGNTETWFGLRSHFTGRIYQGYLLASGAIGIAEGRAALLEALATDWTWLGAAFATLGALWLLARDRALFVSLLTVAAFGGFYSLLYHNEENRDAYWLGALLMLSIAASLGVRWLALGVGSKTAPRRIATVALLLLLPAATFASHVSDSNRRSERLAELYVGDVLAAIEPDGVLFTRDWHLASPLLYYQQVVGRRPDVGVVHIDLTRLSWYPESYLERFFPEEMAACRADADTLIAGLKTAERGLPHDRAALVRAHANFLACLLDAVARNRDVYTTLPLEPGFGEQYHRLPRGIVWELSRSPLGASTPAEPLDLEAVMAQHVHSRDLGARKVQRTYLEMFLQEAIEIARRGRASEARSRVQTALGLAPLVGRVHLYAGRLALIEGRRDDAAAAYERALRLDPGDVEAQQELSRLRQFPR